MIGLRNQILIMIFATNLQLAAQDNIYVELSRFKGYISELSTKIDSVENGLNVSFYDSLKVSTISIKKNGSNINSYFKYYPSGSIMIIGNFDSIPSDSFNTYYECLVSSDGLYESICSYDSVKGVKKGKWKYYYTNGNVQLEGYFIDGLKTGEWKSYDLQGELNKIEIWNEGSFQKALPMAK